MESAAQWSFQAIIDAKKFPAKLWNLVNDPANNAIFWDSRGEIVIINQFLFEKEVLSKGYKNFKSFHRQLNLYGFKTFRSKTVMAGYKYFQNPNFKIDHPELLHKMTRKQVKNRVNAHGPCFTLGGEVIVPST
uniref:HSF-type DNA-binding domain-containing protein n=1 Tax=Gouania willdenowi TaxID=441366 RepID=A0A8C5E4B8_GOUWI